MALDPVDPVAQAHLGAVVEEADSEPACPLASTNHHRWDTFVTAVVRKVSFPLPSLTLCLAPAHWPVFERTRLLAVGHWIQECPTNSDPTFNDRPRIKRTTGIPKSFLTTVEGPQGDSSADGTQPGASGVMVTAEGGFVVARPDK